MNTRTLVAAVGAGGVLTAIVVGLLIAPGPDCAQVEVECTAFMSGEARAALGIDGGKYQTFLARGFECSDGGLILPVLPGGAEIFDPSMCSIVARGCDASYCGGATLDGGYDRVTRTQNKCFCWQEDAGACRKVSDNSRPPAGNNILTGAWSGAGCMPVPCGELYGEPSWPDGCK